MAAELIGRSRCPLCSSDKARLSLSKRGLSCLTCDGCNLQVFARSDNSDTRLRALVIRETKPDPNPEPAPTAAPAPVAAPASPPAPAPAKKPAGLWGAW